MAWPYPSSKGIGNMALEYGYYPFIHIIILWPILHVLFTKVARGIVRLLRGINPRNNPVLAIATIVTVLYLVVSHKGK